MKIGFEGQILPPSEVSHNNSMGEIFFDMIQLSALVHRGRKKCKCFFKMDFTLLCGGKHT